MDKQRFQPLTSAAVVALALPVFTLGQSSHVNAATTPAVTAVKTSYNAKTKSLTIAGKKSGQVAQFKIIGVDQATITNY